MTHRTRIHSRTRDHQLVAQLVSYPMGRLWARFIPTVKVLGVSLNPGPFTIKEHVRTDLL